MRAIWANKQDNGSDDDENLANAHAVPSTHYKDILGKQAEDLANARFFSFLG